MDPEPLPALRVSPSRTGSSRAPVAPEGRPSLWSCLRDSVGKDLSRIALPVHFNEPVSFLQRLAEDVEYSTLLDRAARADVRPADRAALVAAFVASHLSSTAGRASKPANPLLGETFDLVVPERALALVCEQVSHHPPMSAVHVRGEGWVYHTAHEVKSRFLGNSLEVWPQGAVHVEFPAHGEHYVYEQAHTFVHNIIMGGLWLDNCGSIQIQEVSKGATVTNLKLKKTSFLFGEAKTLGELSGKVAATGVTGSGEKAGKTLRKISGNWNEYVKVEGKEVWRVTPRPPMDETGGHTMTAWAWRLNAEPSEDDRTTLPPTDSRLRPDQRALENGKYRLASEEKCRLEDGQRHRRKEAEALGEAHRVRWFVQHTSPITGKMEWRYNEKYFAAKDKGFPDDLPNIF